MFDEKWTRTLAVALVLPLAAACAETGDDELDDGMETLETTPTEMNRVELEPFGTSDVEGWVTSRAEGDEVILTLSLDRTRTGTPAPGEVGAEGEMDTDSPSARLIEGTCMDVRSASESPAPPTTGETGDIDERPETGQESVETVAEFEESDEPRGMEAEAGQTARTQPSSGHTLEARVEISEITGFGYAVVVEEDEGEAMACADVTRLVTDAGSPAAGSQGTPGTGGLEGASDESGTNY